MTTKSPAGRDQITNSDSELRGAPGAVERPVLAVPGARAGDLRVRRSWSGRIAGLNAHLLTTAIFAIAGVVLFIAYLGQARTMPVHLDIASASGPQTLQAWDMLHGNLLLRGWQIGDVSYYTTELPEYMLVELIRGLNGDVVHIAAALTYTMMVLLAALLAKGSATGREGLVRMLVASGILLTPALVTGTSVLLSGPDHTGTQVPLLLAWLVLDRRRPRWWVPALVTLLLAWAMIADTLVLIEGAIPLLVVCGIRMYRRRGPLAGQWYDLSLAAGAIVSVAIAKVTLDLIRHAGGFSGRSPTLTFSSSAALSAHFWQKAERVLGIFSADFFGLHVGQFAFSAFIHLVGLALVVWAVALGVRRFLSLDVTDQVLTTAFVVLLAAYMFGAKSNPNEMVGLLPIGAVLAGRLLAGEIIRTRLAPVLAVALVCSVGLLYRYSAKSPAPNDSSPAASWFEAHQLTHGLATFEEAYSITVQSGGRVQATPARIFDHRLVAADWENDASWYNARRHYANFVVISNFPRCGLDCPGEVDLRNTFGQPIANYSVGQYRVLVWRHNLLANVPLLSWCQPSVWEWAALGPPSAKPCN